ncbi:Membrane protein involved in the export of O-antigen and teichoic acid [Halogranum rubrum]|uniref:Membrane protein involved in the export of O-antigen and teichoic acid n=1 Tax=Halogranum rubrum TaxID=553466 RepID=A0A1I4BMV3_9EURY|nr:oligosaccharide flippase family protein [Halogranum rubrum]SFK69306.1 Membrane protein involved in the export of O-antigen and teichoic acid [Halogranum rubrum]
MADRFFRDAGLYAISTVFPAILGLALVSIFSHAFTAASYGEYSLAMVFVTIISTFSTGWLEQAILRYEPETDTDNLIENTVTVLVGEFVLVVGLGIIVYFIQGFLPTGYQKFYAPVICLALTLSAFRISQAVYQSKLQSASLTKLKLVRSVLQFVVIIGLAIYILDDITGWLWGTVLATGSVTMYMAFQMEGVRITYRPDTDLVRRMFVFGVPLIGWAMAHQLLNFSDRFILEILRGSTQVGIYSSNYTIASRSLGLVSGPFIMAVHPIVMNTWTGENHEELSEMVRTYTRYFLIVGVPAVVYLSVLSEPVAEFMLAESYANGYLVIPIVASGTFIWGLSNIGHKGLEAKERTFTMLAGATIAVVLNIVLNIPLIQRYGYLGAALATLLSFSFYPVFIYFVSRNGIRWQIPTYTVRNVLLGCIPIAIGYIALWFTTSYSILATLAIVPVTGLFYLVTVYSLGEASEEEIEMLRQISR